MVDYETEEVLESRVASLLPIGRNIRVDLLSVPDSKNKILGDRALSHGVVREWNKIPLKLRQSSSLNVLTSKL